ncbi:MAG: ATP phosphoribosyltransferase regulatory subunit, partial [Rikenellaceae bacterium]
NEVELIQMAKEVFEALNIGVTIKINNRKVLYGIAQTIGHEDKLVDITVAIDKLEKIGLDAVNQELAAKGLEEEAIETLRPILTLEGTNSQKLEKIGQIISGSEIGRKGVEELATIFNYITSLDVKVDLELDLSLARGLNYYTGAIFEVKAKDFAIGSITGGGRYDDLTGIFGLKGVSGVGISFGADRIYDVMNGLSLYPQGANETTKVMFVNFGANEELESLKLLSNLRESGVSAEIYPDSSKMKKQMDYANRRRVPYVVIIGESELQERKATIKNMIDGNQDSVEFDEIVNYILQKS